MNWKTIIIKVPLVLIFACQEHKDRPDIDHTIHEIKKGETIFDISQRYELSISELKSLNPDLEIDLSDWKEGTEVIVSSETKDISFDNNRTEHEIQKGETIFDVSQKYNSSITEIKSLNPQLKQDLSGWEEGVKIVLSTEKILKSR